MLITGGVNESGNLGDALLYDETTNTLTPTGSLVSARANHTSTLLLDGRVLITGGEIIDGSLLKSAEIYDPTTGMFTRLAHPMSIPRSKHTATLLQDGTVLIVGGKQADIFDPATELFTTLPSLPLNRSSHAAALLRDGTVLITGGYVGGSANQTGEIYDPSTQTFTLLSNQMLIKRANHSMTLMLNGKVLVVGGFTGTSPQVEVDIFDPRHSNLSPQRR